MSKMAAFDPPPYEAAIQRQPQTQGTSQSASQTLQARLHTHRSLYINDVISTYILPLVQQRASMGLNRTAIALLPSAPAMTTEATAGNDNEAPRVIDIVSSHFGDDQHGILQQVKLTSVFDSDEFWSQEEVCAELKALLTERLYLSTDVDFVVRLPIAEVYQTGSAQPQPTKRRFFSRRISSSSKVQKDQVKSVEAVSGAGVDVMLDEVCMRSLSNFGLYETLTRMAVIVSVRIGGQKL